MTNRRGKKGAQWGRRCWEKKKAAVLIRGRGKWCLSYLLRSLLLLPFFRQMRYPRHMLRAGLLPQLLMGDALFYLMPWFWLVYSPGVGFFPPSAPYLFVSSSLLWSTFNPFFFLALMMHLLLLLLPSTALLKQALVSQAGTMLLQKAIYCQIPFLGDGEAC